MEQAFAIDSDPVIDERGISHRFSYFGVEFNLVRTGKGYARGGDVHQGRQHVVVLKGQVDLHIRKNDGEEGVYTVRENEHFTIYENLPHYMVNLTDSIILEWVEGGYAGTEYDTAFRKIVVRLNKGVLGLDGETGQI